MSSLWSTRLLAKNLWLRPVMVLTARGDWTEKVEGIEAAADDYMAKPFAIGELIAGDGIE